MKAYSQDLRDRVINAYKEAQFTKAKIAETFHIGIDAVYDWINRYNETGDYSSKQGKIGGAKYKFTDKVAILNFIALNPDADGIAIRDAVAPQLAMSTFYDTLKRMEITFKKKSRNTSSAKNKSAKSLSKKSPA